MKGIKKLHCGHCGKDSEYKITPAGQHQKAICIECGMYIKFMPQPMEEFRMPFGQYKGKRLINVVREDRQYFVWLMSQSLKPGILKERIKCLLEKDNKLKY